MGLIELETPVTHIWYVKSFPSKLALLLDYTPNELDDIIYCESYVVINPNNCNQVTYKELFNEDDFDFHKYITQGKFNAEVAIGSEAVEIIVKRLDLKKESEVLRSLLPIAKGSKRDRLIRRLRVIDQFIASSINPSWSL